MLQFIRVLNRCHRFAGFVYHQARFRPDHKSIEIAVRPRKNRHQFGSRCYQPAFGYVVTVRADESRRMSLEGFMPVLKKSRWLPLKRAEDLKTERPRVDPQLFPGTETALQRCC